MEGENLEFKVDHTAIAVSDLDKSMKWYGVFGFEEKARFEREDLKVKGAIMRLGNQSLELFQPYEPKEMKAYRRELESSLQHVGPQHLALSVGDLDKAYAYLQKHGVEFATDITVGKTAKYVFCRDPDGMLLEIKQGLR